jgi:glycosyltransferase involved in cell wall biosynthesis
VYLTIERLLGRLTSAVIAITPLQRQELIELHIAPADKVVEIPLGFDLAAFTGAPARDVARARLGVDTTRPLVVLVARLVPVKDVTTFVRGVAILRQRIPGVQAVVVGDGTERTGLEALARELGLDDTVAFWGWRADIENVYAAADVVALTSLNEGSPVTLIEAMSCGRPVVATRVGGVPDVVADGESGLLVPPRDPEALANALAALLRDPGLRARYGDAARAVAPRFTKERLIADMERLYNQLLLESQR